MDHIQREIYSRQILLPEIGEAGQEKLASASVLVCGAGGLGSPAALYLAAMGVGRIGLLDDDVVSLSNLNRQLLYTEGDVGQPKAKQAAAFLSSRFPRLRIEAIPARLLPDNAASILAGYDAAVDCLDNFASRFVLNDACLELGLPFVHAGVGGFSGQTMTVVPGRTPCLRCLLPEGYAAPEEPASKAILGAAAGILGAMEAMEACKLLLGLPPRSGMLFFDGRTGLAESLELSPRPDCLCQRVAV